MLKSKASKRKHVRRLVLPVQSGTFGEQYVVSLDYQKADGYWVHAHKEQVIVPVVHGVNEKNNHRKAADIAKQRYPGCRINSVTYC